MSAFSDSVDLFFSRDDIAAAGHGSHSTERRNFADQTKVNLASPSWAPSHEKSDAREIFWPLSASGLSTPHRLRLTAHPYTSWKGFSVTIEFLWQGRLIPVYRLNRDSPLHRHNNFFPVPHGLPYEVVGDRVYLWSDNRAFFKPSEMQGLPYARPLERKNLGFENAIRYLSGEAGVDIHSITLPDYPTRETLFP